jgi:hypothetical protein
VVLVDSVELVVPLLVDLAAVALVARADSVAIAVVALVDSVDSVAIAVVALVDSVEVV